MVLAQYNSDDKPELLGLWWDSWHSASGFKHPKPIQEWEPRFDNLLESHSTRVAKVDDTVVGFVMYDVNSSEISQLFVAPSHHREGIGSQLFQLASDSMDQQFSLKVLEAAKDSRQFYESFGMIETGREINPFNGHDEIIYESSKQTKKTSVHTTKSGHPILISEARAIDARDLVKYIEQISGESDFLSFGPGEFGITVQEEEGILEDYYSSTHKQYFVARISHEIVGALSFEAGSRPRMAHSGELAMSVIQDCWNEGVGSALLDEFLRNCRIHGVIKKLNLHVRSDNQRALRLYRKKGFEVEGTVTMDMCVNGCYYDHHLMGLTLNHASAEQVVAGQRAARRE